MWEQPDESSTMAAKIRFANRHFHLPQSKPIRIGLGILLVACGLVGFLPVVGFWMIPLGLLVLSVDIPIVRRGRGATSDARFGYLVFFGFGVRYMPL